MIKLKKFFKLVLCLSVTSLFSIVLTLSFFVSTQSLSNESSLSDAHGLFLVSHLDYYHNLNLHDDSEDTKEMDHHSHKHKHSENGQEHTHEHLKIIVFSDLVLHQNYVLKIHIRDLSNTITNLYYPIISDPFFFKILRPPILG